ncbi:hypothetical protein GE061_004371 [Apolygus lucorum]|uniref:Lipase n=1 Tax=Apolygus lucorum TaxID=248454 RepID=A0A8S9X2Z9_APOLU|nr:hypothetical protein GE061_004371 [Apolygus lucorum]
MTLLGIDDYSMPKEFLNTQQLIEREGYDVETHDVTTEDGYILPLTRMVPKDVLPGPRPPVLLVHGVMATSDQWVLRGKDEDLAFLLTDHGFDVWLADARGNANGRRHKNMSPGDPRFWDFTFTESALYDLPAFVDLILNVTKAPRLGYVGHSMGTTMFFILASMRPEYNSKIFGSVHLAPVGPRYPMDKIPTFFMRLIFTRFDFLMDLAYSSEFMEIGARTPRFVSASYNWCNAPPPLSDMWLDIVGYIIGEHRENLDRKNRAIQLAHFPAGSSAKTLHHLAQVFSSGFRMFDYGPEKNLEKYNSTEPPEFPLNKITSSIFLVRGANDPWTTDQGVTHLKNNIPGWKKTQVVDDPKFSHVDFVIGMNTNETLYPDVIQFLKNELRNDSFLENSIS